MGDYTNTIRNVLKGEEMEQSGGDETASDDDARHFFSKIGEVKSSRQNRIDLVTNPWNRNLTRTFGVEAKPNPKPNPNIEQKKTGQKKLRENKKTNRIVLISPRFVSSFCFSFVCPPDSSSFDLTHTVCQCIHIQETEER